MQKTTATTTIRDVFTKDRDPLRDLNLIVKIFDESEKSVWIEFEEFVITEALLRYLHQFYTDFSASVTMDEPKMPFWLQGFYGSGKSHFSKVIGYLFQNAQLTDYKGNHLNAIEYFVDNILDKFETPDDKLKSIKKELVDGLKLYPKHINARTLFINLSPESKSETREEDFLESFTSALLKGFNEFLKLSEFIEIAEIEKSLISKGIYDAFKAEATKVGSDSWNELRKQPEWVYEHFPKIYAKLQGTDEASGVRFLEGIKEVKAKQKNIISVLNEINKWAKDNLSDPAKGITGKILIVLDEAGFFFSAKASRIGELMAAAEWVNTPKNEAHVNMIFSAQQTIQEYFARMSTTVDYRTAEQRFKHWTLDKKNIKTVVVKRWLKKDLDAKNALAKLLDDKFHTIIDGTVLDTFKDPNLEYVRPTRDELFETYPFLPYQFPLMIQVTQMLIAKKIVEEQYGGKTRSILSMTRDVLHKKYRNSSKMHFIDEPLGMLVTLPQLYDSLVETLKKKDEDQFRIVENTKKFIEDPTVFTPDELKLPVTFQDVAKAVMLLSLVDNIHVDDANIIKALWYSVDAPKAIFTEKVKKLVSELKKKGNIVYKKIEVDEPDGSTRTLVEYRIPSEQEIKYFEKSEHVAVPDDQVQKWLESFFDRQEGAGKDLIAFIEQQKLPSVIGPGGNVHDLDNAITLKIGWLLDPDLDELLGKLPADQYTVTICLLTDRTLVNHKEGLAKLRANLQAMIAKAEKAGKGLLIITPNLTRTAGDIARAVTVLGTSIKECIRYKKTIEQVLDMPGDVHNNFQQRIKDTSQEILEMLSGWFDGGALFYSDKQERIDHANINTNIGTAIKQAWSRLNIFAYLGQVKVSKEQVKFLLTWDPKSRTQIPAVFKRGARITATIPVFSDANELKPNSCDQYNRVTTKFKEYKDKNPETDQVPGEALLSGLTASPFSWNEQTVIATVAAIARAGEWDVVIGGSVKNTNDDDVIGAFTDWKGNCEKFKNLRFKTAETITQDELGKANSILNDLFAEHVPQGGRDAIDAKIKAVLGDLKTLIVEVKNDLEKLPFFASLDQTITLVSHNIDKILATDRVVGRIKSFIDAFAIFTTVEAQKVAFSIAKKTCNRAKELKQADGLKKYYRLHEFLASVLANWLSTQVDAPGTQSVRSAKDAALDQFNDAAILSESGWTGAWSIAKVAWDTYWQSYITLHGKLASDISEGLRRVADETRRSGNGKKVDTTKLESGIFPCKVDLAIPPDVITVEAFTCASCKADYNALRVFEGIVKSEVERLISSIKPAPPTGAGTGGTGGVAGPGGHGGPGPSTGGGWPGGDVIVVERPTKEERDSWKKYKELHAKIEGIHGNFQAQQSLHEKDKEISGKIAAALDGLKKAHPTFSKSHGCPDDPASWDIDAQACTTCKLTYEALVDLHSAATNACNTFLNDLREVGERMLDQSFEIVVDAANPAAAVSSIEEKIKMVEAALSAFNQNNPGTHKKIKVTLTTEKVE